MAALTVFTPANTGVVYTTTAVSASDTIAASSIGPRGCYLLVVNGGGSPDSVVVVDGSSTPAGNASANLTNSVANGNQRGHVHSDLGPEHGHRPDHCHPLVHHVGDVHRSIAAGVLMETEDWTYLKHEGTNAIWKAPTRCGRRHGRKGLVPHR